MTSLHWNTLTWNDSWHASRSPTLSKNGALMFIWSLKRFLPWIIHHSSLMNNRQKKLWNRDAPPDLRAYISACINQIIVTLMLAVIILPWICFSVISLSKPKTIHLLMGLHKQSHLHMHAANLHTNTSSSRHTLMSQIVFKQTCTNWLEGAQGFVMDFQKLKLQRLYRGGPWLQPIFTHLYNSP